MRAIVMAGGEGTRLRPLTCTRPKPMLKIFGKPVIGHILHLLIKNGFRDIAVTVRYRGEDIEDYIGTLDCKGVNIECIRETKILGTAGGVKNAAKGWSEPFLVISGDCMCDIDLSEVMHYHKTVNAQGTIVCKEVRDPGEYGTVALNKSGQVECFCEKPDSSHAVSNLANTGIYVLNPAVMELVPRGVQYDFAAHLFPDMLNEGMGLFGYPTDSYWCDIGDIKSYRGCAYHLMEDSGEELIAPYGAPKGSYKISPPVYMGKNVTVGINSVIGPYTVLEDNAVVEDNTRIKKSVIGANSLVGSGCDLIGTVIGEGCVIRSNNVCLEGSCIGDKTVVESSSTVSNNVLVWPEKRVPYRSVLTDNLREGRSELDLIGEDGITGATFAELSCERCCRLGEAVAGSSFGGKVGVGYDGTKAAKTIAMAVLSGLVSGGSRIFDFGECFESQMSFFVSFCSLDSGIYITADPSLTRIKLFGQYGLPLYRRQERELESRYKRSDFRRMCGTECNEIRDVSSVTDIYEGQLLAWAGENISGARAKIVSSNPMIEEAAAKCFYLLGCTEKEQPEFTVDYTGGRVVATDEKMRAVTYEKLLVLCGMDSFGRGNNICVPFDAPRCLDALAADYGRTVFRIGRSPMVDYSPEIAASARKSLWAYDGLALIFKLLGMLNRQNKTLSEALEEIPEFSVAKKIISAHVAPGRLSSLFGVRTDRDSQGIKLDTSRGSVTVSEAAGGRLVKIIAEASNMEAARELCVETENKITSRGLDIYHQEV